MSQPTLNFEKTTAPAWEDDPVGWACWLLETHPEIYRQFRALCDEALRRQPGRVLSADQVLHVIRWETSLKAEGDTFKINDHASALFSRLYVIERPQSDGCFRTRKSIFDMLTQDETKRLMDAFESVRLGIRERWP
jgi:hypothetical protein